MFRACSKEPGRSPLSWNWALQRVIELYPYPDPNKRRLRALQSLTACPDMAEGGIGLDDLKQSLVAVKDLTLTYRTMDMANNMAFE